MYLLYIIEKFTVHILSHYKTGHLDSLNYILIKYCGK